MANVHTGIGFSKTWMWRSVLAGLTVGATLASASAAWACSIAPWYSVTPGYEAVDVPRNARVTLLGMQTGQDAQWALERVLPDGTGEPVAVTVRTAPGSGTHGYVELRPAQPLQASTQYRVTSAWGELSRFTTGPSEDTTPPARPTFQDDGIDPYLPSESPQAGAACWVERGFTRFTLKSEGAAHFRLERESGEIVAAGLPENGSLSYKCPAPAKRYEARLIAVDSAGNESAPVEVEIEEKCVRDTGLGCSAAGGGAGLWALLGLAGLLRGARRRGKVA